MNIFRKPALLSILLLLIVFGFENQPVLAQSSTDRTNFEVTELQAIIVATLTGYNEEGHHISRSTPHERTETADYLEQTFEQLGLIPLRDNYKMPNVNGLVDLLLAPYKGRNVFSVLKSTESSKEYVLMGAHYDSEPETPGAIDNASGVAVTFAIADLIKQQNHRKYNYIFVLFDQEEDDEVGSKAFVRFLKEKQYKIHSTHVLDVIGWGDSDTLAFEAQVSDDFIERMYRKTATRLDIPLNITGGRGHSDNKSFNLAGYHSAGFWDDNLTPHIHKPSDTYETVNFDRLRLATYFMFELLTNLDSSYDEL
ncbi:MAG: M28 family peptidase [Balneolaceae bacterium]|nr:M28 family peptidase [Balneolaceae bacterium]MBO6546073.1 M28 family peptidase [Balneolaceae bacterium]MBO6647469.1 M28 family peptidase [Balneolaceae bacterium]